LATRALILAKQRQWEMAARFFSATSLSLSALTSPGYRMREIAAMLLVPVAP
jgi:hypothetical protein